MKKYMSLLIVAATLLFVGCKKNDGFISEEYLNLLEPVPVISTGVNATGSQAIDLLNLAAFQGKFDVKLYFPEKPAPTKVDIVVRKNGLNTNVKVYKAGVTTFPSTYTVTAAEIQALFGTAIVLGDNYDFGADVYVGEKKYEAFPIGGVGNSPGPINMIGYSEFARFGAICAYDPNLYTGNFVVVSDAFDDFAPGDIIVLTRLTNNSFSMTFPDPYIVPFPGTPITVVVNTGNNNVTVAKQKVGNTIYGVYTNPNVAATSGNVAPCSKTLTLNLVWTVDQGSFGGPYPLVLRKQ